MNTRDFIFLSKGLVILIGSLLVFCFSPGQVYDAMPSTINVACEWNAISNACLVAANSGDTVLIASGSCVISNAIAVTNTITVSGSGTNATFLHANQGVGVVFYARPTGPNTLTFSNFTAVGTNDDTGFITTGNAPPITPVTNGLVRITQVFFSNVQNVGIASGLGDQPTLIDHCYFVVKDGGVGSYNAIQFFGNGYVSWVNNGNQLGTSAKVSVVEDCYFLNGASGGGNGFFDGYKGGAATLRHNTFNGDTHNGVHGFDSQPTSFKSLEVYDNIFTNIDQNLCNSRGGLFLFYSNVVYSINASGSGLLVPPLLTYYRAVNWQYQEQIVTAAYGLSGRPQTNGYTTNWINGEVVIYGDGRYTWDNSQADIIAHPGNDGYVLLGASLRESLTNLCAIINNAGGANILYTMSSTNPWPNAYTSTSPNPDWSASMDDTGTNIILTSRMDATGNQYGYPAAMQNGVFQLHPLLAGTYAPATNQTTADVYGCYQWSNTFVFSDKVTNALTFGLTYSGLTNTPNYTTNLLVKGRDYFDGVVAPNYTPLAYPLIPDVIPAGVLYLPIYRTN